jgi:ferric-dicitrate binding protein FerR (iron transport regulator)
MIDFDRSSGKPARQASVWFEKYERGEDMEGFGEWVRASSENRDEFLKMARILRLLQTPEVRGEFDVDAAVAEAREYQKVQELQGKALAKETEQRELPEAAEATEGLRASAVNAAEQRAHSGGHWGSRQNTIRPMLLAAGIAGLVLIGGVVAWRVGEADPWDEYSTQYRAAQEITLKDGSRLQMGTGSKLRVLMSDSERRVDLRAGDVVFDVQRDANGRPFVVVVPTAEIQVLGTQFRLHRQGHDTLLQVQEGEVQVIATTGARESLTATKGQQVMIRRDGALVGIGFAPQSATPENPPALIPSPAAPESTSRRLAEIVNEFNAAGSRFRFVVEGDARNAMLWIDFGPNEPEKLIEAMEGDPAFEVLRNGAEVVFRRSDMR